METYASTIKIALWRRIMFGLRGLIRTPFLLLDFRAVRGKRPPRFPNSCNQLLIDLHTATLGGSSDLLGRLSQSSEFSANRSGVEHLMDRAGVQVIPSFARKSYLTTVRDEFESRQEYAKWLHSETTPKFSFGKLNPGTLTEIVNNGEQFYTLTYCGASHSSSN